MRTFDTIHGCVIADYSAARVKSLLILVIKYIIKFNLIENNSTFIEKDAILMEWKK